jgi:hypothetical protein
MSWQFDWHGRAANLAACQPLSASSESDSLSLSHSLSDSLPVTVTVTVLGSESEQPQRLRAHCGAMASGACQQPVITTSGCQRLSQPAPASRRRVRADPLDSAQLTVFESQSDSSTDRHSSLAPSSGWRLPLAVAPLSGGQCHGSGGCRGWPRWRGRGHAAGSAAPLRRARRDAGHRAPSTERAATEVFQFFAALIF